MLELSSARVAVVTCVAEPAAIDAVVATAPASAFRAAADEAMLVGEPDAARRLADVALAAATPIDGDALVVDASDAWAAFTLDGDSVRDAFARLSQVEPPLEGFVEGDVAHVPARVLVARLRIQVLVPAMWRDAVRERILADCASLGVLEAEQGPPWGTTAPIRSESTP